MSNETINDCMLTTFDNPYDPFEQFEEWFLFDVEKGYNTCAYMGRLSKITDDMSQKEIDEECDRVMDKIIKYDFMNIYKKVCRDMSKETEETEETV